MDSVSKDGCGWKSSRVKETLLGKKHRRTRQRQLDMAVATIQQRYGPWSLIKGRSTRATGSATEVPHIPTGFAKLDQALHIGGLPKGRVCEILGPATSGKTTLALKFLVQAQTGSGQVAYIDQALYFDPDYAHRCGLDLSRLLIGRTHDLQEALAMTESLARTGGLAALVFDALDFVWADPSTAPYLAATFSRLTPFLARSGMILIVLHESSLESSPALSALAHCAAIRLNVVHEQWLWHYNDIRGYKARVEVLKNKLGPAGRTATITIEFNGTVRSNNDL
jgi:recombination protein RecA